VLGRFLFRWRGVIGLAAFGVVFWLARPTVGSCFAGLAFVLAGLAVRFWASGYIGIEGRAREIGASRKVVSGPYRLLRHPLYVGNFLLVAGMLVALRPGVVVSVAVLLLFVLEYAIIVAAEERDLEAKGKGERGNDEGADEAQGFAWRRAMCEWQTWLATGVALGLVLLKAAFRAR
jgi:protein-S-isoprenylcysteine O-methyltransferase Ste14